MILVPEIKDPALIIDSTQTTLTGAFVDYNPDAHDYSMRRSVIDGTANLVSRGHYFKGTIDWFSLTIAQYSKLKAAIGTVVRLWPYGTGIIPSSSPQTHYPYVDVIILEVRPYHRGNVHYIDAVIISFESAAPYTIIRAPDNGLGGSGPELSH